jgi:1,4-dihydroxy-2-naphthoate octaprenyltransferase
MLAITIQQRAVLLYLGVAMLVIAHQYSAPPAQLNHRGLGEAGIFR